MEPRGLDDPPPPSAGLQRLGHTLLPLESHFQTATSLTTSSPRSSTAPPSASPADARAFANLTCGCKGAGFIVAHVPFDHPAFGQLIPCVCKQQELAARRVQQHAWRLAQLRADLGELADRSFDNFDLRRPLRPFGYRGVTYPGGTQRRALAEARAAGLAFASTLADVTEPAGWLYCFGPVGGGKSHLAAAIANHAGAMGIGVSYASVPRFMRFIKSGFRQVDEQTKASEADQRILALQDVPLLVLDDLGQEQMSPWERTTLFEIFDVRYRRKAPTVITSNLHLEDLDRLHEPVADRIRGMSQHTRVLLAVCSIRAQGKDVQAS